MSKIDLDDFDTIDFDVIYQEMFELYQQYSKTELIQILMSHAHENQENQDLLEDYKILKGLESEKN